MMIKMENIEKYFYTEEIETKALNEVCLEVEQGDFVSIMGPSGCGKSTLLNIMGLIDGFDGGLYTFCGEDVSHYSESQRVIPRKRNIGFVFQSFNLIDELTVYENIELPLLYAKVGPAERKQKTEFVLEKMNIMHRRNHFPKHLSGGQQQRAAVARAVVNNPALILADEPTGNLDSEHGKEVMQLLWNLNEEGTTVVMVTHSQEDAEIGKRVVRMLDGKVIGERNSANNRAA